MTEWWTLDEALMAELTADEYSEWRGEVDAIPELGLSGKRKIPPSRRIALVRAALRRAKKSNNVALAEPLALAMKMLRPKEEALRKKLFSGTLKATGVREGKNSEVTIPKSLWQTLTIDFYRAKAKEGGSVRYSGLLIFDPETEEVISEKRGRGRPGAKKLYMAEFSRRCGAHELESSVKAEANYLVKWFKQTYPSLDLKLAPMTVENQSRQRSSACAWGTRNGQARDRW